VSGEGHLCTNRVGCAIHGECAGFLYNKLAPYTLARFDLTAHMLINGYDTTRPRARQGD
jgi:hypothetical protein